MNRRQILFPPLVAALFFSTGCGADTGDSSERPLQLEGHHSQWLHQDYQHGVGEPWEVDLMQDICGTSTSTVFVKQNNKLSEDPSVIGFDLYSGEEIFRREFPTADSVRCSGAGDAVLLSVNFSDLTAPTMALETVGIDDGRTIEDIGELAGNTILGATYLGRSGDSTVVAFGDIDVSRLLAFNGAGEIEWEAEVPAILCSLHLDRVACSGEESTFLISASDGTTVLEDDRPLTKRAIDGFVLRDDDGFAVIDADGEQIGHTAESGSIIPAGDISEAQTVNYLLSDLAANGERVAVDSEGNIVYRESGAIFTRTSQTIVDLPETFRPSAVSADGRVVLFYSDDGATRVYRDDGDLLAQSNKMMQIGQILYDFTDDFRVVPPKRQEP